MQKDFILPDIGEGIVECELLEWLVAEGEIIVEDQPVAEVMTDKATVQIPAMYSGKVAKLYYQVGDIAKVHEPLFAMEAGESEPDTSGESNPASEPEANAGSAPTEQSVVEDFLLPDIGEGIVECEIVTWHVSEGDAVAEDQPIVEVMTDKAVVEIPAKHPGIIAKLYHQQGEIAKVHAPLFALRLESDGASSDPKSISAPSQQTKSAAAATAGEAQNSVNTKFGDGEFEPPVAIPGRVLASPAVRRIARERNIDLTSINGSGKKGRVLKQDLVNVSAPISTQSAATEQKSVQSEVIAPTNTAFAASENKTVPVKGIQAAMAKQMQASVSTIPHFMVSDELNMDALIALRQRLKPEFERLDVKLSFMPFFIKAMSLALTEYPVINAQLNADATELTYIGDHNIGVAVDSKIGLLVPNIKRVQTLSLLDIAREMQRLTNDGRNGRLSSQDLKSGTISISNIGALGGITATPVINMPEAAIVALGKTQKLPRFNDAGEVESQSIMMVNWSGDHRIIDGATMVKFNNLWMQYLQQPDTMLMHLR